MKNLYKLNAMPRIAGIIALVVVIGFSLAACGEKGGVIEITNGYTSSLPVIVKGDAKEIAAEGTEKWVFDEETYADVDIPTLALPPADLTIRFGFDVRGGETIRRRIVWNDEFNRLDLVRE